MDKRYGRVKWGRGNPRQRTSASYWKQPLKWNREAESSKTRPRIFCASLADWLDDEVAVEWLADLLKLIHETPNCDWLLLTKRPENFAQRISLAADWHFDYGDRNECGRLTDWFKHSVMPKNVWVGTSVEDQTRADERIPELVKIPAAVYFLSAEPLLGPIDFRLGHTSRLPLDWIIFGGESGADARTCDVDWIRSGVEQCVKVGVSPFVKQLGANVMGREMDRWVTRIKDKKGGDMAEWPAELRVREFPV